MRDIAFGVVISVLLILLVVLFCAILIKLYIQKIKKYNQILFETEINHQKKLNQTILETQENTFQNISQELHDDAGQQLTYINFQLEHLKLDFQYIENQINPISQSVVQLSKTIRSLSHSLNNQILSQQDVVKAIATEAQRINSLQKISVVVENKMANPNFFSTNEKIVIYRIFQETVNNALKHSKAQNITITLQNQDKFSITIQDDGVGFNVTEALENPKTNGLQNLISRAEIINYNLQINSEINNGTAITLNKI